MMTQKEPRTTTHKCDRISAIFSRRLSGFKKVYSTAMPRATKHERNLAWFKRHVFHHPERREILRRCLGDTDNWLKAVPSNLHPHWARNTWDRKIFRAAIRKIAREYCAANPLPPPAPDRGAAADVNEEELDQNQHAGAPARA